MHEPARLFVSRFATPDPCLVYEVGSREATGAIRALFPAAKWLGVDLVDGPNVDQVADGACYAAELGAYDYAISTEVFEHAPQWRLILFGMLEALKPGGRVIVTCAGPHRRPHSALDGGPWVGPEEWYCPVFKGELWLALTGEGMRDVDVESDGTDVFATGVKV